MCKSLMTIHVLELIKSSLLEVERRSAKIPEPNDFLTSENGVIFMYSICMKLSAVGESVKNLDKIINHELLSQYPEIPCKNVMGVRDSIVHHQFEVDVDSNHEICKNDVSILVDVLERMIDVSCRIQCRSYEDTKGVKGGIETFFVFAILK